MAHQWIFVPDLGSGSGLWVVAKRMRRWIPEVKISYFGQVAELSVRDRMRSLEKSQLLDP